VRAYLFDVGLRDLVVEWRTRRRKGESGWCVEWRTRRRKGESGWCVEWHTSSFLQKQTVSRGRSCIAVRVSLTHYRPRRLMHDAR